jgi:tropomyosin
LAALRAEIDHANTRADEYTATVKQLESEHIQKDHDLHSLQSKVKLMEAQLEKTENQIQTASAKYEITNKIKSK